MSRDSIYVALSLRSDVRSCKGAWLHLAFHRDLAATYGSDVRNIVLIAAQETLFIPAVCFALNEQVTVAAGQLFNFQTAVSHPPYLSGLHPEPSSISRDIFCARLRPFLIECYCLMRYHYKPIWLRDY